MPGSRFHVTAFRVVFGAAATALTGLALLGTAPASAATACRLGGGAIKHVIIMQFDNVHLQRDNPNVPSDIEQMPALYDFMKDNGSLLSNDHTVLISHTADGILSTETGMYPTTSAAASPTATRISTRADLDACVLERGPRAPTRARCSSTGPIPPAPTTRCTRSSTARPVVEPQRRQHAGTVGRRSRAPAATSPGSAPPTWSSRTTPAT